MKGREGGGEGEGRKAEGKGGEEGGGRKGEGRGGRKGRRGGRGGQCSGARQRLPQDHRQEVDAIDQLPLSCTSVPDNQSQVSQPGTSHSSFCPSRNDSHLARSPEPASAAILFLTRGVNSDAAVAAAEIKCAQGSFQL